MSVQPLAREPIATYPARCPVCRELMCWDRRYREAWCVTRYCREWGKRRAMPPKERA